MKWFEQVQFVAAVPMPVEWAREYGTTVNGMWDDPNRWGKAEIDQAHAEGRRVLVSVPLIALTHRAYEKDEYRYLLGEACRDIFGNEAEVKWYYWDSKPVYAMCLYSRVFRDRLLAEIQKGIEAGVDVISVDEIQTNIGLMSRQQKDPGFCARCSEKFCAHLEAKAAARQAAGVERVDDLREDGYAPLLQRLREDDALYQAYRAFHEATAYQTVREFLGEIREAIAAAGSEAAVTANLTGLGTFLETQGTLWGAAWGELIDFVLMENLYILRPGTFQEGRSHHLLPRGKFTAWYRLASSFRPGAPAWFTPQINVPRELAGQRSLNYYLLMFLEAYANNGRWGYYWWPGVDKETRRAATAPEAIKDYTQFILAHREYYEGCGTDNELAILYANSAVLTSPKGHFKYVALAQALAEAGYQYDVLYIGDDVFTPSGIDAQHLARYRAVLLPEAAGLTEKQLEALRAYSHGGGRVIAYSEIGLEASPSVTAVADDLLLDFWHHYQDRDRSRILSPLEGLEGARIHTSDPHVNVVRYQRDGRVICHVLNYDYHESDDTIAPKRDIEVRLPWNGEAPTSVSCLSLDGQRELAATRNGNWLEFTVPSVDPYVLVVLG